MQQQCTKSKTNGRNIDRSEFAADVEMNNKRVKENPAYYKQRQQLAEHPWGTLKRQRGFDHVLTRGKKNVLSEVSLVFIGYNLSRFIQITEGINAFKELIEGIIAHFTEKGLILSRYKRFKKLNLNTNSFKQLPANGSFSSLK